VIRRNGSAAQKKDGYQSKDQDQSAQAFRCHKLIPVLVASTPPFWQSLSEPDFLMQWPIAP
jgi:hypothetical protein